MTTKANWDELKAWVHIEYYPSLIEKMREIESRTPRNIIDHIKCTSCNGEWYNAHNCPNLARAPTIKEESEINDCIDRVLQKIAEKQKRIEELERDLVMTQAKLAACRSYHTCEHSGAKVPVEGLRPDTKDAISRVASVVCQRGDYLELSTELDCFARAIIAEVERRGCGGSERSEEGG